MLSGIWEFGSASLRMVTTPVLYRNVWSASYPCHCTPGNEPLYQLQEGWLGPRDPEPTGRRLVGTHRSGAHWEMFGGDPVLR
jgi:hypothetical protein